MLMMNSRHENCKINLLKFLFLANIVIPIIAIFISSSVALLLGVKGPMGITISSIPNAFMSSVVGLLFTMPATIPVSFAVIVLLVVKPNMYKSFALWFITIGGIFGALYYSKYMQSISEFCGLVLGGGLGYLLYRWSGKTRRNTEIQKRNGHP